LRVVFDTRHSRHIAARAGNDEKMEWTVGILQLLGFGRITEVSMQGICP
jgi:hypothetical protein